MRKLSLIVCMLCLAGCGKYTMEEAKENGDIIVQNDVANSDRFESFLKKSKQGKSIRFASRRLRLKAIRCCMTSSMMASRITIRPIHRVINSVRQTMIVKTKSVSTRQDNREAEGNLYVTPMR